MKTIIFSNLHFFIAINTHFKKWKVTIHNSGLESLVGLSFLDKCHFRQPEKSHQLAKLFFLIFINLHKP
jgi:hypothetical protein